MILLCAKRGSAGREIFESLMLVQEMDITPVWESVSTRAIVNAVAQGLGLSVLPYLMVKEDLKVGGYWKNPWMK